MSFLGQQKLNLLPYCGFFARLPQRRVVVALLDVNWERLRVHGMSATHTFAGPCLCVQGVQGVHANTPGGAML